MKVFPQIEPLTLTWRGRVEGSLRAARWAVFLAALTGLAHLARWGTVSARLATAVLLGTVVVALLGHAYWHRRAWRNPRQSLARTLLPTDRRLGERALRALTLVQQADSGDLTGSSALARAHFDRLIAQASSDAVGRAAGARARHWRWLAWVGLGAAAVGLVLAPARVVEGLDVLVASDGTAPLPLSWLENHQITVQLPPYLGRTERSLLTDWEASVPEHSVITVSGTPLRPGRNLVLTDGRTEVPLVSDGHGSVLARWTALASTELRIGARFGEVVILESLGVPLDVLPDQAPQVELEGAPKTVELTRNGRFELIYRITDDHGLRQVDLVMRSGGREERRILSRFSGETRVERGGHVVLGSDAFLRQAFLPVHITLEVRDNDPMRANKWGASTAISLNPQPLGKAEAERTEALRNARDGVVDYLARQRSATTSPQKNAGDLRALTRSVAEDFRRALLTPAPGPGGTEALPIPAGLRNFLLGQTAVIERAARTGEPPLRKTEDALLAIDAALKGLAQRDAVRVAKRLAEVADEVVAGAKLARQADAQVPGDRRVAVGIRVLDAGARQLIRLGALGRDLGSVALGDLGRVRTAEAQRSRLEVELAAQHLAGRLRHGRPSFGTARRGGVEMGGGAALEGQSASDADQKFDELARELESLSREHAGEIAGLDRAAEDAEQKLSQDQLGQVDLREQARAQANALRDLATTLPRSGAEVGSARASAASARDHAEAMAESLERLTLEDAAESGRSAMDALENALQKAARPQGPADWMEVSPLSNAGSRLRPVLEWVNQKLAQRRQEAEEAIQTKREQAAEMEQRLARRAGNLAGRGQSAESSLPPDMVEDLERAEGLMLEASRSISAADTQRGLQLMREAQRLIERSDGGATSDADEPATAGQTTQGRGGVRTDGTVPQESKGRAEEFRRRVIEGLGRSPGGHLAPAVKRYAEGLLR